MRGIGAFAALFSAGCSFGFVAGPPPQHAQVPAFTCSDSTLAPILDSVIAGLTGVIFLTAVSSSDEKWAMDNANLGSRTTAAAVYGGFAALAGASAYYGYHTVHACRAARHAGDERVEHAVQALPAAWPPPPPPPGAQVPVPAAPPAP